MRWFLMEWRHEARRCNDSVGESRNVWGGPTRGRKQTTRALLEAIDELTEVDARYCRSMEEISIYLGLGRPDVVLTERAIVKGLRRPEFACSSV